ncbi:MAG: oligosaccharide flippase family protein, partial [Bacteroides sp.]|nr:oligosaccharide flippase family protein [Bacteroides sp.]
MGNNKKDMLEKRAAKAGLWYTVGNILLKGCVFLSLPIFTRLLSTSDFGIYNSYIAYEQILSAIIGLGMYGSIKCARIDFEKELDRYISSIVTLILLVFIALLTVVNMFYSAISSIIGFDRIIVNCLMVQSLGSALLYFYGCKLNVEFKYKSYIGLSAFNTIGNVLLSIFLIIFIFPNERYIGRILGSAFPLVIIAIIIIVFALLRGKTAWSKRYWQYALIIGIPLVPHVVSQSLLSQFDRIMIGNMVGDSEAGIYSYIYTL